MRTKVLTLIVCLTAFSFFACGYCLADGNAAAKVPIKGSGLITINGKSAVETEKAANSVQRIVEVRNAIETASIKTIENSDGKKILDITIPEGGQLIIDKPIFADGINIHGSGSILLTENGALNLLNGQKPDPTTNPNAGVTTQITSGTAQITPTGTFQIAPTAGQSVYAPRNAAVGATMTVKITEEKSVLKKPAGINTPKGAPRLGPNIGSKIIKGDKPHQPDKPGYADRPIAPKP